MDNIDVRHNEAENRFEATVEGKLAVAEYYVEDGNIVFTHTEVPPELSGRGIANHLAKTALDHARTQNMKVIPQCAFIAGYIKRHGEYGDLVTTAS